MSTSTGPVLVLLYYFLLVVLVQSAPVSSPLKEEADRAQTLVQKILKDLPTVHAAAVDTEGLTFDPQSQTANLQLMEAELGIPQAPVLKPLSERFTLDVSLSRMWAGSQLYQGLLGDLSGRVSGLSDLRADLRDLQAQIHKMSVSARTGAATPPPPPAPDLASRLHGNYEAQVAAHLTLTQLRSHCHDLMRSLRGVAAYRPPATQ
ncbi:colony stimulating factor 3 (granulocyte) b [Sphaeramia orbicularis]|uniref:Granulocyte colony-stimulating factor-like n=1 Tax=Sphaeramia orbicularis TaxID=375764 RepID=A0A673B1L7_9TELE|nr:granulocyte colony-stimulating factor-like [Sphaeramia orbicularis]